MENILYMAENLHNEIESSRLYNDYRRAKEIIYKNEELKQRIKCFRKQRMEYSMRDVNGAALTLDEEKHISKMYFDLCLEDDVRNFFESEQAFMEILIKVQQLFSFDLDLDIY